MYLRSPGMRRVILAGVYVEYELRMSELGCPVCLSPALVYPKVLEDDQPVTCSDCGAFVLTYGELKRRAERAPDSKLTRVRVSGC
jgi:hypothetical protein